MIGGLRFRVLDADVSSAGSDAIGAVQGGRVKLAGRVLPVTLQYDAEGGYSLEKNGLRTRFKPDICQPEGLDILKS